MNSPTQREGSGSDTGGLTNRVFNHLLIEIGIINAKKTIFIIGATN